MLFFFCCSFAQNKFLKKNKMAAKLVDMLLKTVAIATVLKKKLIIVMESKELTQSCLQAKPWSFLCDQLENLLGV